MTDEVIRKVFLALRDYAYALDGCLGEDYGRELTRAIDDALEEPAACETVTLDELKARNDERTGAAKRG